ncbi:glycoside hydrolase family 3 C-terminal domain-containing protein, partial [candidate division KSB1 bacterium]|nr:glycoside hydrolase family 3 C-terminal domain-containing protein [candidate division KSB1 bacterium]
DYNTTEISERTLREIYLPPFEAAVRAGVGTVMSAFNDLNGIPASANAFTLTQILRKEWGFKGFVVSDWNSIGELLAHGFAADRGEAGRKALKAGVDMDMEGGIYGKVLANLVESGVIDQQLIDESVRRILRIKYLLGLFEQPYLDETIKAQVTLTPENLALARQLARESIVLLKNEKSILPLRKDVRSIAVIGPLADAQSDLLGTWSCRGRAEDVVSVLAAVKGCVSKQTRVLHDSACGILKGDERGLSRAVNLAQGADAIIAVVGESSAMSGEGGSRTDIGLPHVQLDLLKALHKTGKPMVAVILAGRPLTIPWIAEHIPAVLLGWHGGVQAGPAIADVLFGDYNPSGRLPVSIPHSVGQIPLYYNHKNTGRPISDQRFTSKYLDAPNTPLYSFGFGLSYTRFEYDHVQLDKELLSAGESLQVSVEVKNVGAVAGEDVVQLYVRDLAGSVTRPVKELKGFQRISLRAGESKTVPFSIEPAQLSFYNDAMKKVVEAGKFKVYVGPDSQRGLEAAFIIN